MVAVQEELSTPLVGRDAELARISDFIAEARSGSSSLMITGEPGMGKSSLLQVCVLQAVAEGADVLTATGVELETRVPYAGLHELLLPHQHSFAALGVRHRDALRCCLGLADGPPPSRSTVASATLALVTQLASDSLVILALDDVHWLDRPSAAVLATVASGLS